VFVLFRCLLVTIALRLALCLGIIAFTLFDFGDIAEPPTTTTTEPQWVAQYPDSMDYLDDAESSGSSSKAIIVLVIVVLLVAVAVTAFAYQKKILCFEKTSDSDEEEATGESPLLKETTSASKVSPSRTNTASATTLDKSRPSGTTISRSHGLDR